MVLLLAVALMAAVVARRSGFSRFRPRAQIMHSPQLAPAPGPGSVGARMPDFRLRDVAGRDVSSEEFRGKVLLIDFWATWCPPCKVEMPGYQKLQNGYGERGLVVIGIALDSDPVEVTQFAKKLGIRYTLLLSTPEVQQQFGGILGLPTTLLVDRNGIIRKKVIGFEYTNAFEMALQDLL